jgi:hypothetical protein
MSATAQQPATTPIPVQLSSPEFDALILMGDENENYTGVVSTGHRAATHAAGEVFRFPRI